MQEAFRDYILRENLFSNGQQVLLAVSGGRDSAVMAQLFYDAGFRFRVAHCNFGLRGAESIRDEGFVRTLAERLQAPFHVQHFDTEAYAQTYKRSIQVAARELRYRWLEELRMQLGLDYIATAHHLGDNVETVLMNLSKGTGIAGLHGILPKNGHIIRPLLFATREQINQYEQEKKTGFVEDSSNLTDKYTRNFFRHQVIPKLEEAYPEAIRNIGGSIERFREAETLYQEARTSTGRNCWRKGEKNILSRY
ncbi:tRNA lysidine(34) synthetase TilS [Chitinophaga sedimenti]|uniref:tRNA lysidine(34) synthetase TilS n=1 Tax=Chitinophaga sedimenti TaxID=2033606 RepID=UPI002002E232|nr:tRNA lysidine(34) synthetase TilS [Chitinophaga sedimenti]MCK7555196.1 tRNA lysidine(34) synthetase TilS [Chitinophaga sedimenti]